MKSCYVPRNFSRSSLDIIEKANVIISEYAAQGYDLTLRQLYYVYVSRALIANKQSEYKRLGSIINDARLAGLIDWDSITDRTRNLQSNAHWSSPQSIVRTCAEQFQYDKWQGQPRRVEVWIEKDALSGVFDGVCSSLDVPYFSCRGYTSQSEMHSAAMRHIEKGRVTVLHFGDHDPSGIDMTRDIQDRLRLFGAQTKVERLALTMEQIEQYNPPPNPAKDTDARFTDYEAIYGSESWELDALEPSVLVSLVTDRVLEIREETRWQEWVLKEQGARAVLRGISSRWEDVTLLMNRTNLTESGNPGEDSDDEPTGDRYGYP